MSTIDPTPFRHARVKELFAAALDLPPAERVDFLHARCEGDDALRGEVESLLGHADAPAVDIAEAARAVQSVVAEALGDCDVGHESRLGIPDRIADFRIISVLGEGGMGVVYLAEQEAPRRTVALKVMRPGLAGRQVLRRFRREAELLGRLQHPNIAQIYAAGTAMLDGPRGAKPVPYFALEYIRGRTITEHCRELGLSVEDRVRLFVQVCDAVEYAHAQGIIHRDLKPANVLVEQRTGGTTTVGAEGSSGFGTPKILDFGIARRAEEPGELLATTTFQTEIGQVVGTLPYMSPEQVSGAPGAVDRRSDIYSLGVVLYQMLAGRLPLAVGDRSIAEAVRMVGEEEPTPLRALDRGLRGDLDTIVAKCLEKDRLRRYRTAGELAADLRRFLEHRPIEARPPSTLYQLAKFARRNRGLVAGVALAFATMLAATALAVTLARAAMQARSVAEERLVEATRSYEAAELQRRRSERSLSILSGLIVASDPSHAQGREVSTRDVLDHARTFLAERDEGDPEVSALVAHLVGFTYVRLGLLAEGESMLRRSVELHRRVESPTSPHDRLNAMCQLGDVLRARGRYEEAKSILLETLDAADAAGDDGLPSTALALNNLGGIGVAQGHYHQAVLDFRQSLEVTRALGNDRTELAIITRIGLATAHLGLWQLSEAVAMLDEARALEAGIVPPDHPVAQSSAANLAYARRLLGAYDDALALGTEILELRRARLEPLHPSLLSSALNVAGTLIDLGRPADAEPLAREALEGRIAVLGQDHAQSAYAMTTLAGALAAQGGRARFEEAQNLLDGAIAVLRGTTGVRDEGLAEALLARSALAVAADAPEAARDLAEEALVVIDLGVSRTHPLGARALARAGAARLAAGEPEEARRLLESAVASAAASLGSTHPETRSIAVSHAEALLAAGRADEASAIADEAAAALRARFPAAPVLAAPATAVHGAALSALGETAAGERLIAEAIAELEACLGPESPAAEHARRLRTPPPAPKRSGRLKKGPSLRSPRSIRLRPAHFDGGTRRAAALKLD